MNRKSKKHRHSGRLFLIALLAIGTAGASENESAPTKASKDIPVGYRLGADDVVEINVFGVDEFEYATRISPAGSISIPFIGEVTAAGITATELARQLERLTDGKLFNKPKIAVTIKEYRSKPIVVLGALHKPGIYPKRSSSIKLMDLLAQAGGPTADAGDTVLLQRSGSEDQDPEVFEIKLQDLYETGKNSLNHTLMAGDVVAIPSRQEQEVPAFYVIGEVVRPGAFPLRGANSLQLSQAVAAAGGPLKTAKLGKALMVRFSENGEREEIQINLKKILRGKGTDFAVAAQDIIFIPGSTAKTIGYGLLGVLPGTVQQASTLSILR